MLKEIKPKQSLNNDFGTRLRVFSPRIPTGLQRNLAAFLLCLTRSLEDDSSDNTGFLSRYQVPAREQYPSPVTALGVSEANANHIHIWWLQVLRSLPAGAGIVL